jgi:hypothetical protein
MKGKQALCIKDAVYPKLFSLPLNVGKGLVYSGFVPIGSDMFLSDTEVIGVVMVTLVVTFP